jgi:hypothetical protein
MDIETNQTQEEQSIEHSGKLKFNNETPRNHFNYSVSEFRAVIIEEFLGMRK